MKAFVMTACWLQPSTLTYFWSNVNISSIFYFSKSTFINTQHSDLWDTHRGWWCSQKSSYNENAWTESAENSDMGL